MNEAQAAESIEALLKDAIAETGATLAKGADELALYVAGRSAHLATLVEDPGFDLAIRAERDAVALEAGLAAVEQAEAADARLLGIFQGVLAMGAKALAAGLA
jgi:hypothetical protein